MSNYRRQKSTQYGKRARGVSTLIITAVVIVGIFLGIRVILSGSSNSNDNTNENEIQTLESLLNDVNVPLDTAEGGGGDSELNTNACDGVIQQIDTEEKIVALTFDSINITTHANEIISTLKDNNIPAFFFLTGDFTNDNPSIVQSIAGNGFSIGNHSNTHRDFTELEASDVTSEISLAQENIIHAGGTPVRIVRPPFNKFNDAVVKTIIDDGYCPIKWSIDSEDYKQESTTDDVVQNVVTHLKPGGIIWMNFGHETLASALPSIITQVQEAGYRFVDLAEYVNSPASSTTTETNPNL